MTDRTTGCLPRVLLAIALAVPAPAALAQSSATSLDAATTRVWLSPGIYSRHFERNLGLRENNYGFGVEAAVHADHAMVAGEYRNSNDRPSRYVGWFWRPLHWGIVDLGVMAMGFNGYPSMHDGGWFFAPIPAASIEYGRFGVNLTAVPGYKDRLHGAVAVQFKFRVW